MQETPRKPETPVGGNGKEKGKIPKQLKKHCWAPGQSGNKKGRPKNKIPNVNRILIKACKEYNDGNGSYLKQLIQQSLTNDRLACKILDKIAADASLPGDLLLNVNQSQQETHVNVGEAIADPATADLAAKLEDRLSGLEADAGGNGADRK